MSMPSVLPMSMPRAHPGPLPRGEGEKREQCQYAQRPLRPFCGLLQVNGFVTFREKRIWQG
jgi:hypothetical protein